MTEHGPDGLKRNTHLLSWLDDGYTHCQHGTQSWCESYLKNAAEVIRAQDDRLEHLEAALKPLMEYMMDVMGSDGLRGHRP